jgi:hypothetical protein
MPGRKKRRPADAKPVTIYLTAEERLVLQVIEGRRQVRSEQGDSPSEIVSDALWHFLEDREKMPRKQIEALLPSKPKDQNQSNLKHFPKKGAS